MAKCSTDSDALQGFIDFHKHFSKMGEAQLWCCHSLLKNYGGGFNAEKLESKLKTLGTLNRSITRLLEDSALIVKEELSDYQRPKNPSETEQEGGIGESKRKVITYSSRGVTQICGGVPPYGEKPEPKELP